MLVVSRHWTIPREELEISYVRSGGPGGQNVNKVASKAVVRWSLADSTSVPHEIREKLWQRLTSRLTGKGDLVISSQRFRDAPRNLADCLDKLGGVLQAALRDQKPAWGGAASRAARSKTTPSDASYDRFAAPASCRQTATIRAKTVAPPAL
jgi:ribosome-associated protein